MDAERQLNVAAQPAGTTFPADSAVLGEQHVFGSVVLSLCHTVQISLY